MPRGDGHATGMAGEFFVMEQLFRRGHLPALTLGNAKTVDIFVKTTNGTYQVSVKSIRGGGKWGVGSGSTIRDLLLALSTQSRHRAVQGRLGAFSASGHRHI